MPRDTKGCPVHNRLWPVPPAQWPTGQHADAANVNSESTLPAGLSTPSPNSLEILQLVNGSSQGAMKGHLHFLLDLFGFYYSRKISEGSSSHEERSAQNVTICPQQWPQHSSPGFLGLAQWESTHPFLRLWSWGNGMVDRPLGCCQETELSGGAGGRISLNPSHEAGTMGHSPYALLYQRMEKPCRNSDKPTDLGSVYSSALH